MRRSSANAPGASLPRPRDNPCAGRAIPPRTPAGRGHRATGARGRGPVHPGRAADLAGSALGPAQPLVVLLERTGEGVVRQLRPEMRTYAPHRGGDLVTRVTADTTPLREVVSRALTDPVTGGIAAAAPRRPPDVPVPTDRVIVGMSEPRPGYPAPARRPSEGTDDDDEWFRRPGG